MKKGGKIFIKIIKKMFYCSSLFCAISLDGPRPQILKSPYPYSSLDPLFLTPSLILYSPLLSVKVPLDVIIFSHDYNLEIKGVQPSFKM